MRAAIYHAFGGPIRVEEVAEPKVPVGGVLLRVGAAGLCRSDWHGWMGHDPDIRLPHVAGHEFAGEVVAVGEGVTRWRAGARVTVPFVCGCGACPQCASGNHQVCDHQVQPGFTHWGAFAELVAVERADVNLVQLPDSLDFITAASLGCRFATAFRAVAEQGRVAAGTWVAVHGCGGVGLSAVMIARALGANVVAVDVNDETLALASELGAAATVNARRERDVVAQVRAVTDGGAHLSLDALGSPETCFNSIACLRKRGRHVQVGLMVGRQRHPAVPMDRVIADELELLGSHGMQAYRYPALLAMIEAGTLAPARLLNRTIRLDEVCDALPAMGQNPGSGVTVIDSFAT